MPGPAPQARSAGRLLAVDRLLPVLRDAVTVKGWPANTAASALLAVAADVLTKSPTRLSCPGSNESAGRIKSTKTRPGNPYLKGALGVAALSTARSKDTYLAAKYRRIASRRGPMKALVAVEHSMLIAIWHMLTNGVFYDDLGGQFFAQRNPDQTKKRALDQLRRMGYDVTLTPLQAAG